MKKNVILLILMCSLLISCSKPKEDLYLFIDPTDEMIVKEEDRYYYIFNSKEIFDRFTKDINYNPDKGYAPGEIIDISLYCKPLYTPDSDTKFIDSKQLKLLNIINRTTFFERITKDKNQKKFFVEKISDNNYSVRKVSRQPCL